MDFLDICLEALILYVGGWAVLVVLAIIWVMLVALYDWAASLLRHRMNGVTPKLYAVILEKQGGGCDICGEQPIKGVLPAIRNGYTGEFIGLWCKKCHQVVSGADIHRLQSAINYLTRKD